MADIKAFRAIRPDCNVVHRVAALPYDVYNRAEALIEVQQEPLSFLKIDRAETQFDDSVDTYDERVYRKAKETLEAMISDGTFVQDSGDGYYIYELIMNGHAQSGIVACASIDDYTNNRIKKHEKTRAEKEIDRINHVDICDAQTGPIFLAYRSREVINQIVDRVKSEAALYDFVSPDGVSHRVWLINDIKDVEDIREAFAAIDQIYIADGHHRAASAVKVGQKRREENPGYTGEEEFNYFLCVLFPHDQLAILPYNRVVTDLNGKSADQILEAIGRDFDVECKGEAAYGPEQKAEFGMYLEEKWYALKAKPHLLSDDPVKGLDVSILQDNVLEPVLGIGDPKTDKRIDFVGGIRGLKELERRCHTDMAIAFSMYATSINELFDIADADQLMPPKSTWFEPKLRSGLFIHALS